LYRQGYELTLVHVIAVQDIDNWAFDVFQINEIGEGHALKYVGLELLQKYDLVSKYKVRYYHIHYLPDKPHIFVCRRYVLYDDEFF